MPLQTWKKLRQEFELKNPWWTYRKDVAVLPSGKEGEYHYVHVKGSSMVIPQMEDGKLVLVNQYRYLADRESIEFPCGSVKEHATYDETAQHELAEETGFEAATLSVVAEFNPYNGVTDEMCRVYVAKNLRAVESSHDETEEFEQVQLTPLEFDGMVRRADVWDGMTLAAWALTRHLFLLT